MSSIQLLSRFILFLLLFCVSFESLANSSVVTIYADDKTHTKVQQLVFEFERPVTYAGGVPSAEQLEYVSIVKGPVIGGEVKADKKWQPKCLWRYVDTKRLACELKAPLIPGSIYHLAVNKGFVGLNGWILGQTVKHTVVTPYPSNIFSPQLFDHNGYDKWPILNLSASDAMKQHAWMGPFITSDLKVRRPDGSVVDIDVDIVQERLHAPLNIDMLDFDFSQDGRYELFIPKGAQFEFADYPTKTPIVLYWHEFHQDFKLLGLSCYQSVDDYYAGIRSSWSLESKDNCLPLGVHLAFSRQVSAYSQLRPLLGEGRGLSVSNVEQQNGRYVYEFNTKENMRYSWDLSSIVASNDEPYAGETKVSFSTKVPPDYWFFTPPSLVTPADFNEPLLLAISVKTLAGTVKVIDTKDKLQAWLKGEPLPSEPYEWPMVYDDNYIWQDGAPQVFDYQSFLPSNSGLLALDFSNEKLKSINVLNRYREVEQSRLVTVNGFNVQLFTGVEGVIQTTDWQLGKPIVGVSIHLVCANEALSAYLGQTDEQGLLKLSAGELTQGFYGGKADGCWLLAKGQMGIALVDIHQLSKTTQQLAITAYSAQPVYEPGKTIDFGLLGKMRTEAGLKAIDSWDGRQLYFGSDYDPSNLDVEVTLPEFSTFGMASVSIPTQSNWPVGRYYLKLYRKDNPQDFDILGEVGLEYYEVPEFEVTFNSAERFGFGEGFDWSLEAKRLNGVGLAGANVQVEFETHVVSNPPFWPEGYTWLTDSLQPSEDIEFSVVTDKLDSNGSIKGRTYAIERDFGVMGVDAIATVTAKDGEAQSHTTHGYYLGADYYFGVDVNTKEQSVKLVVINKDGKLLDTWSQLSQVMPEHLTQSIKEHGVKLQIGQESYRKNRLPVTCYLDSLFQPCLLDGLDGRLIAEVSINDKLVAKASFYVASQITEQYRHPIEFTQDTVNVPADKKQVSLTLQSKVSGKAFVVVSTDSIEDTFYIDIVKGSNDVVLPLKRKYMPQVQVEVLMSVTDEQMPELKRFANNRVISAKTIVGLQQDQGLAVSVQLPLSEKSGEYVSGELIDVSISANLLADSQTWLVNEGLWQLLGVDEHEYDLARILEFDKAGRYSLYWSKAERYYAQVVSYLIGSLFDGAAQMEGKAAFATLSSSVQRSGYAGDDNSSANASPSGLFVDSIWFAPLALKPSLTGNSEQSLQFNLPKVPGRYKLVTLATNDDQFDLDVQTITTYLPEEYFVDAPVQMVQSDKAQLLITAINRTDASLNENLKLTIDGKPWRQLNVKGKPNSQQVLSVDIAPLSEGEHVLGLWHDKFGQVGQRNITVKADTLSVKRQFVLSHQEGGKINIADNYIAQSLKVLGRPLASLAPSWDSHLQWLRYYPYQCFEQNISRAVSYAYSPIASSSWPEGEQEFERLINAAGRYKSDGGFGFFAQLGSDGFLTAYSHLVASWLSESVDEQANALENKLSAAADKLKLTGRVKQILADADLGHESRSMALLALAKAGELTHQQVLEFRSEIGVTSGFSQVLQLLALQQVNAEQGLIDITVKDILRRGYQDAGVSILSDNAQRCFAYMALSDSKTKDKHPRAEQLLEQVLAEQWQQGDFGNTFASAICSVAFKDKVAQNMPFKAMDYELDDSIVTVALNNAQSSTQVVLEYQQPIDKQQHFSRGIGIEQQYYIATDTANWHKLNSDADKWRLMPEGHVLQIGDLVKVVITIDSPIAREHVVINSPIAGAFEVDNAKFEHSVGEFMPTFGGGEFRRTVPLVEQQVEQDRVLIFPARLFAGQTEFDYLLKVRHGGKFIASGAKVELMYQNDVAAQTIGRYFDVTGY